MVDEICCNKVLYTFVYYVTESSCSVIFPKAGKVFTPSREFRFAMQKLLVSFLYNRCGTVPRFSQCLRIRNLF